MKILTRDFFKKEPEIVAKELLGKILVRKFNGKVISGIIVETEAYLAVDDEAAHSYKKSSQKTKSLYLDAGHAYVHSIHAYYCLDAVCQQPGVGGSVLIRALEPLEGVEIMQSHRGKLDIKDLTSGPGKLCKSLGVDRKLDGIDLTKTTSELAIYNSGEEFVHEISMSSRIGITKSKDFQLRFFVKDNKFISK